MPGAHQGVRVTDLHTRNRISCFSQQPQWWIHLPHFHRTQRLREATRPIQGLAVAMGEKPHPAGCPRALLSHHPGCHPAQGGRNRWRFGKCFFSKQRWMIAEQQCHPRALQGRGSGGFQCLGELTHRLWGSSSMRGREANQRPGQPPDVVCVDSASVLMLFFSRLDNSCIL